MWTASGSIFLYTMKPFWRICTAPPNAWRVYITYAQYITEGGHLVVVICHYIRRLQEILNITIEYYIHHINLMQAINIQ